MTRRLLTTFAALALLVAACGDDDDTATDTAAEESPPMGPADLTAEDQSGDGEEVTVRSVTLPAAGFVVIHADDDGAPGPVIGNSELLPEGTSNDVVVELDEPLEESARVWPMAHIDTNTNDDYDFDPPDSTEDGPATFADGEVAVVAIEYTVDGADGGDDESGAGEETAVTIVNFSFEPETVDVTAGTTVVWTNEDGVTHTATSGTPGDADGTFDETVEAGAAAEITMDEPGAYAYFCAIHPNMTGEVVVS